MDIPDELLPESDRPIDKRQTFTRMVACLEARITDEAERDRLRASVDGLRAVNTVRNKLTHGGGSELVAAMCIFESNIRYRTMGRRGTLSGRKSPRLSRLFAPPCKRRSERISTGSLRRRQKTFEHGFEVRSICLQIV